MYLEKIQSPNDVQKLSDDELLELAKEMRSALIQKASVTGAHLGPNLGVVEMTIALHRVFHSPVDKIVFDVSHQCYCHKMLTGRAQAFLDEDMYATVSGYTNPEESEHDLFHVGHTATSVSLACGLAKARDCVQGTENIIAVIGDGALSGGEAYEGLNFAKELGTNLIIIVNDNQMSIAENHGALYDNLQLLRESDGKAECNFFKALGLDYHFLRDGHDIFALCELFEQVKDINHPVVLHICTVKGKGYCFAEAEKEDWHFRPPFHIEDGDFRNHFNNENYDEIVYQFLNSKMHNDEKVVAVVAAVPLTIGFDENRRKAAGKQFVDVGIAEEHAVTMAAGIAKNGGKPVFATHASFFQRAYDQIAQDICINKQPVTLLVRNASVWGMNDLTHLGFFDIPLISNIPNMVYLAPTNKEEYIAMLDWSIEQTDYPVAIRIPRNGVHHTSQPVETDYSRLNKNLLVKQGEKVAIIALGDFFQLGESVCEELVQKTGIHASLINPRYITGVDVELLHSLLPTHELIITLEDGVLAGGYGEKVASFLGTEEVKVKNYGLKKEFVDRYKPDHILQMNRLTPDLIVEDICKILQK